MHYPISRPPTLAVIYGNRDFFPKHLVAEALTDIAKLFGQQAALTSVFAVEHNGYHQ